VNPKTTKELAAFLRGDAKQYADIDEDESAAILNQAADQLESNEGEIDSLRHEVNITRLERDVYQGQMADAKALWRAQLDSYTGAWLPIVEAPRTGEQLILKNSLVVGAGRYRSAYERTHCALDFYFEGGTLPSCATHFKRLPKP